MARSVPHLVWVTGSASWRSSNDNNLALRSVAENLASTALWIGRKGQPVEPERSVRGPETDMESPSHSGA
jgi:hypothetical protein